MTTLRASSLWSDSRLTTGSPSTPFSSATHRLIVLLVVVSSVLAAFEPTYAAFAAAVVCGWSEVDGLCGRSHVGTLSPLRLMRPRTLWIRAVAAYTAGGLVTAALVGGVLGVFGGILHLARPPILWVAMSVAGGLALILMTRELEFIRFPLPQVHRQTCKAWAFQHGTVPAAAMWGAHIGLAFFTVVQHGGLFVIVLYAGIFGPFEGALLLTFYWLGRTLPLWFARTLKLDACNAPEVVELLLQNRAAYRHAAAAGLLCLGVVALLWRP